MSRRHSCFVLNASFPSSAPPRKRLCLLAEEQLARLNEQHAALELRRGEIRQCIRRVDEPGYQSSLQEKYSAETLRLDFQLQALIDDFIYWLARAKLAR